MADARVPLFHIGYHKTATTWLQKSVWPKVASHRFVRRRIVREALLFPRGLEFKPETARSLLELEDDGRPILVSDENISGYIHTGGLHGLMAPEAARRIKACYPDAEILVGIRNQFDAINASYAQYILGGGTFSRDEYVFGNNARKRALRHQFKNPSFSLGHFNYDRLIGFYESLFGLKNVHVMLYENIVSDAEAVLDWIESECGVSLRRMEIETGRRNTSAGATTLQIARVINYFRRGWVANKVLVSDVAPSGFLFDFIMKLGRRARSRGLKPFSETQREMIFDAYAEGNRWLAERRNLSLAELGYPV